MTKNSHYLMRRALAVLATGLALGSMFGNISRADMYHPPVLTPGGVPAQAVLTISNQSPTSCTFSWYGMRGWSTVEAKNITTNGPWSPVVSTEATDFAWSVTASNPDPTNSYAFRLNQLNSYLGSKDCRQCHITTYNQYAGTPHASAYTDTYALANFSTNCLTVGYGQPTGFFSPITNANLENVGCENCHGPAGWHASADHAAIRPAVSIDPMICGGCHSGSLHPTYEQYTNTLHAQVNDDLKYGIQTDIGFEGVYYTNTITLLDASNNPWVSKGYFIATNINNGVVVTNFATGFVNSTNPATGYDRQTSCGVCHSGAARAAMLSDYAARQAGITNPLVLPTVNDASAYGPTCAICHDPHSVQTFTNVVCGIISVTNVSGGVLSTNKVWASVTNIQITQLRNPTWSTNYYTMPSLSDKRYDSGGNAYYMNTTFASLYDPTVNVCGQCHNTRGYRWDGFGYGLNTSNSVVTVTNYGFVNAYATNWVYYTNSGVVSSNTYLTYVGSVWTTNTFQKTNSLVTAGLTSKASYSRPPHLSPQYNMIIGIVQPGYLTTNAAGATTNYIASHSGFLKSIVGQSPAYSAYNTNQCVTCHMPAYTDATGKVTTGHTFQLNLVGCNLNGCHLSSGNPNYEVTQSATRAKLSNVVALLNNWAKDYASTNTSLASAYATSLQNTWEYTLPGALATLTNAGPAASSQTSLPANIRQARFNIYMIYSDKSFGVHNPGYTGLLFSDAEMKVLSYYPIAAFGVSKATPYGAPGAKLVFTNTFAGATNLSWDFGDTHQLTVVANASAIVSVTNTYASVGNYTVKLTAIANGVTQTLVRTNYITIAALPTASFTATPSSGSAGVNGLTVSFDGTASTSALNYKWTFVAGSQYAYTPTATYTFTNQTAAPITYKVILTVANLGGSASATNSIIVNP